MYCRYCAQPHGGSESYCPKCGRWTSVGGASAFVGGLAQFAPAVAAPKQRVLYVLLALFTGFFGVHNYYAGYTGRATAQLLITVFTGWLLIPLAVVGLWNVVEIIAVERDASGGLML